VAGEPWHNYADVSATDASNAFAVSEEGSITRTTNGTNWSDIQAPVSEYLRSVSAVPGTSTAWAVGDNGRILKTTDNGATWVPQIVDATTNFQDVHAVSTLIAVAAGDTQTFVKTVDGGTTWTTVEQPAAVWNGSDAFNRQVAVFVGSRGLIKYTANGGTVWGNGTNPSTRSLDEVDMVSASIGWAVGMEGTILKTTDGGATWSAQTSGTLNRLHSVKAADSNNVIAVGDYGTILLTSNGGASWSNVSPGTTQHLYGVDYGTDTIVYAAGNNGVVLRSANGGTSWTTLPSFGESALSLEATDADTILVGTSHIDGMVRISNNSGSSWTSSANMGWNQMYDLSALDDTTFVAANVWGRVFLTYDQGASWIWADNGFPVGDERLMTVSMVDATTWFASTNQGSIHIATGSGAFPDFQSGVNDFVAGTGFFGVCLRDVSNGAIADGTTWTPDSATVVDEPAISADCGDANSDPWHPIPVVAEKVVHAPMSDFDSRAHLRFGARVPMTTAAGTYRFTVKFEVLAPNM
jgi:photosystem II stability/assembly factor-like uncharacterized protein